MKHNARATRLAIAGTLGLVLIGLPLGSPISAAGNYNVTMAGFNNMTPLVALATSSEQPMVATNIPANVGLYALHCAVPTNPRSAPTLCDNSADSAVYLPATPAPRDSVTAAMKINGEFYGTNPNPQSGATAPASVDCRATTAPGTTACAVYILGAGRESANPTYMRVFPTVFSPVKADRMTDTFTVTPKAGSTVTQKPSAFSVKTASGLVPTILSSTCSFTENDTQIAGLSVGGNCEAVIWTTGGKNYKPLVQTVTYTLG
jgi:hypothetical protein